MQQDAIYKPLNTEYEDKSCQLYSDFQNSAQDLNIAVEENEKNENKEKKDKIIEEKNKNESMNKTNYIKNKSKKKKEIKSS